MSSSGLWLRTPVRFSGDKKTPVFQARFSVPLIQGLLKEKYLL